MKQISIASFLIASSLCLATPTLAKTVSLKLLLCGLYNESVKWMLSEPVKEFEKTNPGVKVTLTQCSWEEIREKMALGVASGSSWDIFMTGAGTAAIDGMAGLLLPLDGYLSSWKEKAGIYPKLWDTVKFKGKTYGIPIWADPRGMVYNKQLFARMGLDPNTPPQSWDAILTVAKKGTIIDGTKKAVVQVGWTSTYPSCSHQDYAQFYSSASGTLISADMMKPAFNTPMGIETARFMTDLYQTCNPSGIKAISGQDLGLFAQGKAALCRGLYLAVVEGRKKSQATADNIGFFPIKMTANSDPVTMSWVNALAISRGSKQPDLAFKFLKSFCTSKHLYKFNDILGSVSPRADGLEIAEQSKALSIDWYRNLKHSVVFPTIPETQCIWKLDEWLWKAWSNRTSPVSAIDGAGKDWQRMLDRWWSVGKRKKLGEGGK